MKRKHVEEEWSSRARSPLKAAFSTKMAGVSLTYNVIITLLLFFILPTEIGCCSMNTFEIITLMSQNPNFQRDPCYIQWKAEQDAKLSQLWTQREQLEKAIAENDRRDREYEARERENRHRSYLSSSKVEVKLVSADLFCEFNKHCSIL